MSINKLSTQCYATSIYQGSNSFPLFTQLRTLTSLLVHSLCQRLSLTWSMRINPPARRAKIERRRRESPPEAKDEGSESFAGGVRGSAKQIRRALTHKSKINRGGGKARFNVATPTNATVTCTSYVLPYNFQTKSI